MKHLGSQLIEAGGFIEAAAALSQPDVKAVVLPEMWSRKSLEFVQRLVHRSEYSVPGRQAIRLSFLPASSNILANAEFNTDMQRIEQGLRWLGRILYGKTRLFKYSRIEPTIADDVTMEAGEWHVDSGRMFAVSAPGGVMPQHMAQRHPGQFTRHGIFQPFFSASVEADARSLPADSIVIAKGTHGTDGVRRFEDAFVHRRDNLKLMLQPNAVRVFVHMKLTG